MNDGEYNDGEYIILIDGTIHNTGIPKVRIDRELVRCKDCKFWEHQGWKSGWCEQFNGAVTFDNDFCSRGKRRDDGD